MSQAVHELNLLQHAVAITGVDIHLQSHHLTCGFVSDLLIQDRNKA